MMRDSRYWELVAKYFTGEASEREIELLEARIGSDSVCRELLDDAAEAWEASKREEEVRVDVAAAWRRIEDKIDEEETGSTLNSRTAREDRRNRPPSRGSRLRRRHLLRVGGGAAILLIAVLVFMIWRGPESEVFVTKRGERSIIELVDGTRVHLNAGSQLTLLAGFGHDRREVELEGEAYFDVAHDKDSPFLVRTPEGAIQVVGTAFNVNAYPNEREAQVAVAVGVVALHLRNSELEADADTVVLRPRQAGVITEQRLHALRRNIDLAPHVAWKEGQLVFEDAPFPVVVRRLERWYDLHIEADRLCESPDLLNAVFDQESANEVISDIAVALGLRYEQDEGSIRFLPATECEEE